MCTFILSLLPFSVKIERWNTPHFLDISFFLYINERENVYIFICMLRKKKKKNYKAKAEISCFKCDAVPLCLVAPLEGQS